MKVSLSNSTLSTQKRRIAQRLFRELDQHLSRWAGQPIALAVSGGLDSRALLEAVARWPLRAQSSFLVVTVNHHTRPECDAESRLVVARAKALGFETEVVSLFPGARDEASLRSVRYSAIGEILRKRGIKVLCTAHQRDDDAEGVIMDLFGFGGGANGSGINLQRNEASFGTLVRPLLHVERKELLLFLTSVCALDFLRDPSNENGSCARQKAREFLRTGAHALHPRPIERLAGIAQKRTFAYALEVKPENIVLDSTVNPQELRSMLQIAYKQLCPDKDPRNAGPVIELMIKKATSCAFIGEAGVDPRANSITLKGTGRLSFDLPGAKALMAPGILSLYRNLNDLLVQ